jgi:hypothetical protein
MRGRAPRAWAGLLAVVCAACAYENAIRVAPTSNRDSLVFVIGGARPGGAPTPVYGLSVVRCADGWPVWTIAADGSHLMPERIAYGQVVPGFVVHDGPQRLSAGCYKAIASEAAPVLFDVSPSGQVSVRP